MESVIYQSILQEYQKNGERLHAYYTAMNQLPKGTLVKKRKGSKEYYYLNHREGDKVYSDYVGCSFDKQEIVIEGLEKRATLEMEIDELTREREACKYALMYKGWRKEGDYNFSLYFGDVLVADVFSNLEESHVFRYEKNPAMQLFYSEEMNRMEIGDVLASRCWDPDRENLDQYLEKIGVKNYNPYEICRKTHGIMLQDAFWIKFLGETFDGTKILRRYGFV